MVVHELQVLRNNCLEIRIEIRTGSRDPEKCDSSQEHDDCNGEEAVHRRTKVYQCRGEGLANRRRKNCTGTIEAFYEELTLQADTILPYNAIIRLFLNCILPYLHAEVRSGAKAYDSLQYCTAQSLSLRDR